MHTQTNIYIYIYKEKYYKKVAHVFVEAEKFQDLQCSQWETQESRVPGQRGLRTRRVNGINSNLGLSPKAEDQCPSWKTVRQREDKFSLTHPTLLFSSGLQCIGWDPLTLRRAICYTQFTNSNINLIQKLPQDSTEYSLTKYLDTPWSSQVDI